MYVNKKYLIFVIFVQIFISFEDKVLDYRRFFNTDRLQNKIGNCFGFISLICSLRLRLASSSWLTFKIIHAVLADCCLLDSLFEVI
ncbi:unnamed protein product [Rhizophagus irregularis]|nr:unnamed protein product [Rhizophagus irregularis]CAB4433532.1 unnamed protein product [Rhizophagus irregularis]